MAWWPRNQLDMSPKEGISNTRGGGNDGRGCVNDVKGGVITTERGRGEYI